MYPCVFGVEFPKREQSNVFQSKTRFGLLALLLAMLSMPVWAQSTDDKIQELQRKVDELDQRVRVAERNKELKDEEAADNAKNAATVSADTSGFKIE